MGGKNIKKGPGPLTLAMAFFLGSVNGILGLHLIQEGPGGGLGIHRGRFLRHLAVLFLAGLMIGSVLQTLGWIHAWVREASGHSLLVSFLFLPSLYVLLEVLWPGFLGKVLGTRRTTLCPQCYQIQVVRFQPVSFQFGTWVTYLCPYCSCLTDAWGEQVLYPSSLKLAKVLTKAWRTVLPSLMALALGVELVGRLAGWR